jgi:sporulation protein YlmC with PRC-barrel domain
MKMRIFSAACVLIFFTASLAAQTASSPVTTPSVSPLKVATQSTGKDALRDHRASKLIGAQVFNTANENIGEINDLIIDHAGKVSRVILGVGGFLGLGEHEVAVSFPELRITQDGTSLRVTSSLSRQGLSAMPQWRGNPAAGYGTSDNQRPAGR